MPTHGFWTRANVLRNAEPRVRESAVRDRMQIRESVLGDTMLRNVGPPKR